MARTRAFFPLAAGSAAMPWTSPGCGDARGDTAGRLTDVGRPSSSGPAQRRRACAGRQDGTPSSRASAHGKRATCAEAAGDTPPSPPTHPSPTPGTWAWMRARRGRPARRLPHGRPLPPPGTGDDLEITRLVPEEDRTLGDLVGPSCSSASESWSRSRGGGQTRGSALCADGARRAWRVWGKLAEGGVQGSRAARQRAGRDRAGPGRGPEARSLGARGAREARSPPSCPQQGRAF